MSAHDGDTPAAGTAGLRGLLRFTVRLGLRARRRLVRAVAADHGRRPGARSAVARGPLGITAGGVGPMFDPGGYRVLWAGVGRVVAAGVVFGVMDRLGMGDH